MGQPRLLSRYESAVGRTPRGLETANVVLEVIALEDEAVAEPRSLIRRPEDVAEGNCLESIKEGGHLAEHDCSVQRAGRVVCHPTV